MKELYFYRKMICVLCIFATSFLYAHGSLSKRIKQKTVEINKHPKNGKLYFERGFLYEQHEEFNKAIADYLKSEKLGYSNLHLNYRKAQTYYYKNNFSKALASTKLYLKKDSIDVKINKLHAQILVQLARYKEAIKYYAYFIENAVDINPNDILEYSSIYLAKNSNNYPKALEVLEFGFNKLGNDIFSLQLKKLDYLEASLQVNKAIGQYNYFILNTNRKEFWYYKKAKYLFENKKNEDAIIAIQQAKFSILALSNKFQKTVAIKDLQNKINNLENDITKEN